jgi:hypothetical protein
MLRSIVVLSDSKENPYFLLTGWIPLNNSFPFPEPEMDSKANTTPTYSELVVKLSEIIQ